MDPAALSVVIGVTIILLRGALVIAPEVSVALYRRAVETNARARAFGAGIGAIGLGVIGSTQAAPGALAGVLAICGWALLAASLSIGIFPRSYRQLAESVLGGLGTVGQRAAGLLGVAVGCAFVYFGCRG